MMKARTFIAPVAVAALAVGGVAFAAQQRPKAVSYVTAPVVRASVTQSLTTSGTADREGRSDVTFDADGTVTELAVKVGDPVAKGQALAAVDPAPLQVSLLQARAQLAQAQAVLDADQTALDNGGSVAPIPTTSAMPSGAGVPAGGSAAGMAGAGAAGAGVPGSGAPGAGAGAGAAPAYVTALQKSLGGLQGAVAAQQAACQPVYAVAGKLQGLGASLPTALPTTLPSSLPTGHPGSLPSRLATSLPTSLPTALPSSWTPSHTAKPAVGTASTGTPSAGTPSASPSAAPSRTPSVSPSASAGTRTPSASTSTSGSPSASPTAAPSPSASATPTGPVIPTMTGVPSQPAPSASPTARPSVTPNPALPSVDAAQAAKLAAQIQACTGAMIALAGAEQDAGQAIVTASAAMQQSTAAAQAQLVAAQQQMAQAAQAAAQQAAAQAMAEAQAQLAAQAARALGSRVTDATIASDEARVLQARQAVERAERQLAGATLVSPLDGTVGASNLVAGEPSAGRSVTVVGAGAAQVPIEVPLSARALVAPGQEARVGLVGADPELSGRVVSVSVLPTSSSGTPTYTAKIAVDDPQQLLKPGAKAEVTLALRTATDVLTVPVSAVTKTADNTGTVQVVPDASAASAQTVSVRTGSFGGGRIEITSGLGTGQLVVLADRREPVPGGLAQYQMRSASPSPTVSANR